jgi:hypothetical protein
MRRVAVFLVLMLFALGFAGSNTGVIQLTSFPNAAVADGHSTINIEASVRDSNGRPVPDGTPVVLATDLGTFQTPIVLTQNGVAHARLSAPSNAGVAKITASAVVFGAVANLEVSFVSDASMLSKAKEYIEVDGDNVATYSYDQKMIMATATKKTVHLRYRDVQVEAERIQVDVANYDVVAKNCVLKVGKEERKFGYLNYTLNQRTGYGTTTYMKKVEAIEPSGRFMRFVLSNKEKETYGVAEVQGLKIAAPDKIIDPSLFRFADAVTATTITARKITAFPQKKVLFEVASVYMGSAKVMKLPLYQLDLNGPPRIFADTIFNVTNNQLSLDYPYYLTLKPGVTQLLRLQTGTSDSNGIVANRGVFLNYEYKWDRGDDMQGGVGVQGLGRNDWGLEGHQSWHFNNGGTLATQLEFPSHQSLFGTISAQQPFKGYEASIDASAGHTLTGTPFDSQNYSAFLEKNPFKIGNIPANFYVGLEAYSDNTESVGWFSDPTNELSPLLEQKISDSQTAFGPRLRAQSQTWNVSPRTTIDASVSMAKLYGHNALNGLTYSGNLSINTSPFKNVTTLLSYGYTEDGFESTLLGRQQFSLQTSFHPGKFRFDAFGIQGLDADRNSYQLEASYQMTRLWRLGYAYQQDRYFGANYSDFDFVLGYRVGYKEFGLVWSQKLHRLGFQLLGTAIN